jgi:phage tail tape-measure protein
VDDQTLTCRIEGPRYFNYSPEVFFDRRDLREVRLEHSDDFHAYVGTGIGFVTGAAIGAAKTSASPGVAALIYGTVGGLIGHELGPIVAVIHGQVIYRR